MINHVFFSNLLKLNLLLYKKKNVKLDFDVKQSYYPILYKMWKIQEGFFVQLILEIMRKYCYSISSFLRLAILWASSGNFWKKCLTNYTIRAISVLNFSFATIKQFV